MSPSSHDDHLRAVMLHELATLDRYAIGHDDARAVAAHRAYERQADALVAARRFDDDAVRADLAALFGLFDHLKSRTGLHRSAHVHAFELHQYLGGAGFGEAVKADEGRAPHGFQHIVVDHGRILVLACGIPLVAAAADRPQRAKRNVL